MYNWNVLVVNGVVSNMTDIDNSETWRKIYQDTEAEDLPPHYWNTAGKPHKVCYSLVSNCKLLYPYYDDSTKFVVLRKTGDNYETLKPVIGGYPVVLLHFATYCK